MNKWEMADRLAVGTGLDKAAARDAVDLQHHRLPRSVFSPGRRSEATSRGRSTGPRRAGLPSRSSTTSGTR